jgi:hypothetical protein
MRLEVSGGYIIGTTPMLDGEWHHVAVVVGDQSDVEDAALYVDGTKEEVTGSLDEPIDTGILPLTIGGRGLFGGSLG